MRSIALVLLVAACGDDATTLDPDAPRGDARIDAGPCGLRAGTRGKTTRMAMAGGLARTYHVYLPAGDPQTPMPLVFVHHGYTMSGQLMFDITGYATLADAEGFAVAFPDGQGGTTGPPWNVGTNVCPSYFGTPPLAMGDDFAFLDAMKADIAEDQCIDDEHVFMTGFSMGGYFSHHAGCMRADIRAVAPHSGGTHELSGCVGGPTPILMLHGVSDNLIPVGCNDPTATPVAGHPAAATRWATHNGCAMTTTSRPVMGGTCTRYDGCPAGGQVEVCTFTAMGHCWAGGAASQGLYSCPAYESATTLAWQFWRANAW